jgi:hypothetical protein
MPTCPKNYRELNHHDLDERRKYEGHMIVAHHTNDVFILSGVLDENYGDTMIVDNDPFLAQDFSVAYVSNKLNDVD